MYSSRSRSSSRMRRSGFWHEFLLRTFWHGGSTYDAWLNICSTKLASRLLTIPNATAEMGLPSAIVMLLLQLAIGYWTSCIINLLYLRHRKSLERCDHDNGHSRHSIQVRKATVPCNSFSGPVFFLQLHEVIGGLLGPRWLAVSTVFNITNFFCVSSLQLLACSNLVYLINNRLDKRTWVLAFGAIFSLSIFTPTAHNYKVWSFVGVVAAVFASGYLTVAPLRLKMDATHTGPHGYTGYFNGVSGFVYFGHDTVSVEIMDAMWKPQEFRTAYLYSIIYVLIFATVPSFAFYAVFGDKSLKSTNALVLLPKSNKFYETTVVLLLVHQVIVFGIFVLGIYMVWEKLLGVHRSPSYIKRTLLRIPIFLAIWLATLAFPFYGVINRLVDSALMTWNLYIIPCAAYNAVFWSPSSRRQGERPFSRMGWATDFSINLGIILWVLIVESGFGIWSGLAMFTRSKNYMVFAKCQGC